MFLKKCFLFKVLSLFGIEGLLDVKFFMLILGKGSLGRLVILLVWDLIFYLVIFFVYFIKFLNFLKVVFCF